MLSIYNYETYIKFFFIFGFSGWFLENIINVNNTKFLSCNPIVKKKSNNISKKICIFPFLPIYALSGLGILIIKSKISNIYIRLLLYIIFFNSIELLVGIYTEKYICNKTGSCAKGDKPWQYDTKYNFLGYIDLEHSIYWLILGFLADKMIDYIIYKNISIQTIIIICIIIYIIISLIKYKSINNINYFSI